MLCSGKKEIIYVPIFAAMFAAQAHNTSCGIPTGPYCAWVRIFRKLFFWWASAAFALCIAAAADGSTCWYNPFAVICKYSLYAFAAVCCGVSVLSTADLIVAIQTTCLEAGLWSATPGKAIY
jgi:hypothetical protein